MRIVCLGLVAFFMSTQYTFAQSSIPPEYRGSENQIARGVLEGNQFESNYRNHGEMARWGDNPWGVWPNRIGGKHIDGIGFALAAQVVGEREKWPNYYGDGVQDTLLNPVIINYRQAGVRVSPYSGNVWGWLPLQGFHNPDRRTNAGTRMAVPAQSDDHTSWPDFWPDRMNQTEQGWPGLWNGFLGKGLANGAQESFYVMDDYSDYEYAFGIETEGPHSPYGVYYPNPSDSSIGGLGTQVEVRHFQFNDVLSEDLVFSHYRISNNSEKDLEKTWATFLFDLGLGADENDDNIRFDNERSLVIAWDNDGLGISTTGTGHQYELGYVGFMLLEHSLAEENGIDEDNDGIIDESKFNGPGDLIEGKEDILAYLNANYNMDQFSKVFIPIEEFPAVKFGKWWTGDEDLDWVPFTDWNGNYRLEPELGETLKDDIGKDGLGPWHEHYIGPDEGEGDGIPTQGEPNFGERDMLEAEKLNKRLLDVGIRPYYENVNNLRDDSWLFKRIEIAQFEDEPENEEIYDNDPFFIFGYGPFSLKKNTSSYVITALLFAESEEELFEKATLAKNIYESDYGQTGFLTGTEDETVELPTQISLSQNYPNPFNPSTNIQFSLNKPEQISLQVFDVTGRLVSEVISGQNYTAGTHQVTFNASHLSSGIYFYRLNAADQVITKKLTLIK